MNTSVVSNLGKHSATDEGLNDAIDSWTYRATTEKIPNPKSSKSTAPKDTKEFSITRKTTLTYFDWVNEYGRSIEKSERPKVWNNLNDNTLSVTNVGKNTGTDAGLEDIIQSYTSTAAQKA